MTPAGGLLLLGAALLLTSGGDCDICPEVREDVNTFLSSSLEDYLSLVKKYQNDPLVLENAKILKTCVDAKLTERDKANAHQFLERLYASRYC